MPVNCRERSVMGHGSHSTLKRYDSSPNHLYIHSYLCSLIHRNRVPVSSPTGLLTQKLIYVFLKNQFQNNTNNSSIILKNEMTAKFRYNLGINISICFPYSTLIKVKTLITAIFVKNC
jgi:hypothetical protein